ncbi:acyl-CoA dehydrogenase family protein [Rhodococcus sp. NCIMB 12038]|jgi:alkylation response protein AidB-like acyl-CoA dehydrogenase|uniref:acyl-CoA dehydrogenase family protein n=1 Tax=Rhodococcus sp. NCIMB 12038 TaxID=933800 RepID=UPI000B3C3D46|nr:acyl-CoA dehydrogenase family protein [Rhodococcus sp. NCIMB 12038]OUS88564.1 acyl-CoA dehydrogenase [Rhodococcus sp. NCIMB 12038]
MNFELDEEQKLLRDTTREVLTRAYDTEKRNDVVGGQLGWSSVVWKQLAEVGVLGLGFSEEDGGTEAGPVEIMAVMAEVGRRLAPEPVLDAVLVPGGLISDVGSVDQRKRILPGVAEGSTLLAFAHNEPGSRWPHIAVNTTASVDGEMWSLSGTKNPVPHGGSADLLVVSATLPGGDVRLFLVDGDAAGLIRKPYRTHDGQRAAQISFTDVAAEPLGGDASDVRAAIVAAEVKAQTALCAEAVGAMEEALTLTTDYLKQRRQFGVPLANFQALTFRAADMYVLLELARSMSLYATMSLAGGIVDPKVASRAKLQISRSSRKLSQEAIQLHGGIGVTAEYPVGHYASRLTAIEHTYGSAEEHLRVLAQ